MTDLATILPNFPVQQYTRLIPALEKHLITTVDLLTLDSLEIAKRASLPVLDVKKFCYAVLEAFQVTLGVIEDVESNYYHSCETTVAKELGSSMLKKKTGEQIVNSWATISVMDPDLDHGLRGGIPTGSITEVTGESGAGKTQFLLTLLLSVQLPPPHGLSSSSLYISTESGLPVTRLRQLLLSHPGLISADPRPSLDRIVSIVTPDLESQDHILYYQVPVAIKRYGIRLLVIDSVASNYRAEYDQDQKYGTHMAKRTSDLLKLGQFLRKLAVEIDIAVVVANQVADRILNNGDEENDINNHSHNHKINYNYSSNINHYNHDAPIEGKGTGSQKKLPQAFLTLDHQQRWFTGWGDEPQPSVWALKNLKTPSLGLIWTSQIACRIALIKRPFSEWTRDKAEAEVRANGSDEQESLIITKWRRWMKVVFANHAPESGSGVHSAVEFEIREDGLKTRRKEE